MRMVVMCETVFLPSPPTAPLVRAVIPAYVIVGRCLSLDVLKQPDSKATYANKTA